MPTFPLLCPLRLLFARAALACGGATAACAAEHGVHALAAFGEPKYGRGFSHFESLNPQAPQGGTLYLSNPEQRTSLDKLNDFTIKGIAPAGIAIFMLEPLALLSADEPQTRGGLLAAHPAPMEALA
ncbi:MAG: hypothetical protein WCH44_05380 [Betaproteobacteria bacterium]